jgi:hypothetical protein
VKFGAGLGNGEDAGAAAWRATAAARDAFGREERPKLAIVFVSPDLTDGGAVVRAVRELAGEVNIVGGTSGGRLIAPTGVTPRGVSVVLLGGDDVAVATREVRIRGPELFDVVTAGRELAHEADAAAQRGLERFACFAFAPSLLLSGEALASAIRKGAGVRAQLAGGLTGDDFTFDRSRAFARGELRDDHVALAGLFTRKPIGIAARHGFRPIGAQHVVTRAEGEIVVELDRRPALDVWLEEARRAVAMLPESTEALQRYLTTHQGLGIAVTSTRGDEPDELVVRTPFELLDGGRVRLASPLGEGLRVHVVQANRKDLLRASTSAATDAAMRVRGPLAGALVLSCSGRLAVLGEDFSEEWALIRERVAAPIGGACVFGEIAKSDRALDAFFNTTVVVAAFGA